MKSPDQELFDRLMAMRPRIGWREVQVELIIKMGLLPGDKLEFCVTSESRDVFKLVQRGVNAFLTVFQLYPTSVAVHSEVASMLEASETVITAQHKFGANGNALLGEGFTATPLRIEINDSLDINTVAVRFSLDMEEYGDAMMSVLERALKRMGE